MGLFSLPKLVSSVAYIVSILIFIASYTPTFVHGNDGKPSAYEVLQEYGFPIGLLPEGVSGYELNRDTGEFSAYLSQTCRFSIDSYSLEYKSTITGIISKGRLRNLKGVSVYLILVWVNIVEVVLDGDDLEFSVGIASANFPAVNFLESPQCGCGFDCNKLEVKSLVTS